MASEWRGTYSETSFLAGKLVSLPMTASSEAICRFEGSFSCGVWQQDTEDTLDWQLHSGATDSDRTGPLTGYGPGLKAMFRFKCPHTLTDICVMFYAIVLNTTLVKGY